ncbi:MAG: acyltransferase [Bacilli bacterium]|nr:acyltransferase [Bacilli bacterium]
MEEIIKRKRDELKEKFDRVLPVGDYFSDRWEKGSYLNFGSKSNIYDSSYVFGNPKVGENCWIGPFTILDAASGSIEIGNNTTIAAETYIYTHDTSKYYATEGNIEVEKGNVKIGNNTAIASKCIICPNVTIGDNCIIGAGSLVNKNIPNNSIAFGTPAKVVGKVIVDGKNSKIEYF